MPVEPDGILDLDKLDEILDERVLLVSVMAVNNEIGVLQPLADIAERCRRVGAIFHTDATQAAARLPIDVDDWNVDLLSLSDHKVYAPKGVGALYVRSGVELKPIITGGAQERGLRGGTLPTGLIAGFGAACELAAEKQEEVRERIDTLTARLYRCLREAHPGRCLFVHERRRVVGNLNIGIPGIAAEEVIRNTAEQIAVSSGSACSSTTSEPSRALPALGLDPDTASTGFRISLGRFNTIEDIDKAIATLSDLTIPANRAWPRCPARATPMCSCSRDTPKAGAHTASRSPGARFARMRSLAACACTTRATPLQVRRSCQAKVFRSSVGSSGTTGIAPRRATPTLPMRTL